MIQAYAKETGSANQHNSPQRIHFVCQRIEMRDHLEPRGLEGNQVDLLVFVAMFIGACATFLDNKAQKLEEEWEGKNFNDLMLRRGLWIKKMGNGKGGKIFISISSELSPDSDSSRGSSHGGRPRQTEMIWNL